MRCRHCYQESTNWSEMSTSQIAYVLKEFSDFCLLKRYSGQVTFTGGEPFVRSDFLNLLNMVRFQFPMLRFAILTNGTLLTEDTVRELARLRPNFVQISLDGAEATHDQLRGHGNYCRALRGLELLHHHRIRSLVSFTAHQHNYLDFPKVVEAARQAGATRVWTDRLVPCGKGEQLDALTPVQTCEFFTIVHCEQLACAQVPTSTQVAMERSLQFLISGEHVYRCSAGRRLLAVMPDGLVYPCRRLPIPVGNVLEVPFANIRRRARKMVQQAQPCSACEHSETCRGGSRCLAYAVSGSLSAPDPGCWLYKPESKSSSAPDL